MASTAGAMRGRWSSGGRRVSSSRSDHVDLGADDPAGGGRGGTASCCMSKGIQCVTVHTMETDWPSNRTNEGPPAC